MVEGTITPVEREVSSSSGDQRHTNHGCVGVGLGGPLGQQDDSEVTTEDGQEVEIEDPLDDDFEPLTGLVTSGSRRPRSLSVK